MDVVSPKGTALNLLPYGYLFSISSKTLFYLLGWFWASLGCLVFPTLHNNPSCDVVLVQLELILAGGFFNNIYTILLRGMGIVFRRLVSTNSDVINPESAVARVTCRVSLAFNVVPNFLAKGAGLLLLSALLMVDPGFVDFQCDFLQDPHTRIFTSSLSDRPRYQKREANSSSLPVECFLLRLLTCPRASLSISPRRVAAFLHFDPSIFFFLNRLLGNSFAC